MQINKQGQNTQETNSIFSMEETNRSDWSHSCHFRNFGEINSWWECLKPYLEQLLPKYTEIVLLNSKEEGGKELIELLHKELKNNHFEINEILDTNIVAVFIDINRCVSKIEILEAKIKVESQLETLLKEYNGNLRING